jgi:TolB-like protein
LVLGVTLVIWLLPTGSVTTLKPTDVDQSHSIAILPFDNLDGDPNNTFLGIGLADTLLNGLGKAQGLTFAARRASFSLDTTGMGVQDIGSALGVDHVLDGSVLRHGNMIRLTVQLTRVSDSVQLYSEQFDREISNVLSIQDEVATSVVRAMEVHLDDEQRAQMLDWGTTNVEAYLLVTEANYDAEAHGTERQLSTLDKYRRAITLDPMFLDAYRRLAENIGDVNWFVDSLEHEKLKVEVANLRRAVEMIDADWPGLLPIKRVESRLKGSMLDVERSVRELIPHHPDGLVEYGRLLVSSRLFQEAVWYLEKHYAIVPNPPIELAAAYLWTKGLDAAIYKQIEFLTEDPEVSVATLTGLVKNLARAGRYEEAEYYLALLEKQDKEGIWTISAATDLDIFRGNLTFASVEFQKLLYSEQASNYSKGHWCFMLGEINAGAEYWRNLTPRGFQVAAYYTPVSEASYTELVRNDPRYQDLLNELGIGSQWTEYMKRSVLELEPITGIPLTEEHGISG